MNCPKCDGSLSMVELRGTQVDKCSKCRGIWFDEHELETIMAMKRSDLRSLGGHGDDAFNRAKGKCPRDGSELMRVCARSTKIVVDVCPECQGLWLDGGELHKLKGLS